MNAPNRLTVIALAAGAAAGMAPVCAADGTARSGTDWPGATSADEVRALVAEMLSDAETRSSLLQSGAGAGHDGKFFLASPDGTFRLNVSGQVQFRYTANFRDDELFDSDDDGVADTERDDFEGGFQTTRMALRFDGHIYEKFIYGIQGVFDRSGGRFTLEDAFAGYTFDNGLILIAGQYREPILWEEVINDTHALAVDQSVVNAVFNQGRSQGVWLHYQADDWRMWVGVNDGIRSANTDLGADPADIGATTRWEMKFGGDWAQFNSFSSPPDSEMAVKLGGGAHYEIGAHRPGVADFDLFAYTGDVMVQGDGWNVFAMGVGLYMDPDTGPSFNDYGFMVQGGFFVDEQLEPFVRYDVVVPDSDRAGDDSFNTVTFGANYYLHGHAAKLTVDVQWFLDDTVNNDLVSGVATGASGSTGNRIGLLPSGEEDQVALRLQFQLLF